MDFYDLVYVTGEDCKIDVEFFDFNKMEKQQLKNLTFSDILKLDDNHMYARVSWFNVPCENKISVLCILD